MSDQPIEQEVEVEEIEIDDEPLYYKPRSLSLMATLSGIISWIVLAGYVADIVIQVLSIQAQLKSQQLVLSTLMAEPSFNSYIFTNLILPLLTGLTFFCVLQGVSIGLNAIFEIETNTRETIVED